MRQYVAKSSNWWKSSAMILPGIGITFLPKVICPFCWPLYAGILSPLGLGFLMKTTYLLPITILFLGIAMLALGLQAASQKSYGAFILGCLASLMVISGKFVVENGFFLYGGSALLTGVFVWSLWSKTGTEGICSRCIMTATSVQPKSKKENIMSTKHQIEIFSAGCAICEEAVAQIKEIACPECEIHVLSMKEDSVSKRAKALGVRTVPAVVIDGALAKCCKDGGMDMSSLKQKLA